LALRLPSAAPQNVLLPTCGASLSNITHDIQLLSQLTNKLRLYGSNCNQTSLVLQAIRDTNVQMGVYVAVYVDADEQAYEDQVEAIRRALVTYGTGNVLGVSTGRDVGREAVSRG
jgi:glucan 1,3-beta-glucosidase